MTISDRMVPMATDPEDIQTIALLAEPVRRSLYDWVIAAGRAVGRDEAARATGVSRTLAAFHLDRLVEAGLLTPEYRRLSGRSGPGAGRPAKLYRRGPREAAVTLPERHSAGRPPARGRDRGSASEVPPAALRESARHLGRSIGDERRRAGRRPRGKGRSGPDLVDVLRTQGFEPCESAPGVVRLGNCPFHELVAEHRDLVCGMNLALAEGILAGLRDRRHVARLDPQPGSCCVAFEEAPSASA